MKWWQWDYWKTAWLLLLLGVPVFIENLFVSLEVIESSIGTGTFMLGAAWGFLIFAIARLTQAPVAERLMRVRIAWPVLLLIALGLPLLPFLSSC